MKLFNSDGVEYSTFEYELRVLALRIFEYEYFGFEYEYYKLEYEYRVHFDFFAVKLYTLTSVAGICCINWNHFSGSYLFNFWSFNFVSEFIG